MCVYVCGAEVGRQDRRRQPISLYLPFPVHPRDLLRLMVQVSSCLPPFPLCVLLHMRARHGMPALVVPLPSEKRKSNTLPCLPFSRLLLPSDYAPQYTFALSLHVVVCALSRFLAGAETNKPAHKPFRPQLPRRIRTYLVKGEAMQRPRETPSQKQRTMLAGAPFSNTHEAAQQRP